METATAHVISDAAFIRAMAVPRCMKEESGFVEQIAGRRARELTLKS
jgi:hypothetical protein